MSFSDPRENFSFGENPPAIRERFFLQEANRFCSRIRFFTRKKVSSEKRKVISLGQTRPAIARRFFPEEIFVFGSPDDFFSKQKLILPSGNKVFLKEKLFPERKPVANRLIYNRLGDFVLFGARAGVNGG